MNDPHVPLPDDTALASAKVRPSAEPVRAMSPVERLEASRARLRTSWLREPSQHDATAAPSADDSSSLRRIRRLAAAGWARHPLKGGFDTVSQLAGPVVQTALAPIAQAHPMRLLAIAAVAGGVLAWLRPWRLLPHAALSSVAISALLPRAAIARYIVSGRWVAMVRAENFQRWFRAKTAADPAAAAAAAASMSPSDPPPAQPTAKPPLSDGEPLRGAPASYASQAAPPIAVHRAAS